MLDSPLDLQFSVSDSRTLSAEQIPEPLKRYLDDLNALYVPIMPVYTTT